MNSVERHERRYQRRKAKRVDKKNAKLRSLGGYSDVFSYENLYEAFYSCRKGVRWKASIQSYEAMLPLKTLEIYNLLKDRKFKPLGFLEFNLNERGKMRHIKALKIDERCVQRALCDNYLSPLIVPRLIYDNGASIENKGIDFTLRRLKCFLSRYYRKYHTNEGYVLQFDFKSYFDNIDHEVLLSQLRSIIHDTDIYNVVKSMVTCFGDKGLGLGSQVSQIAAIYYPNLIDQMIKRVSKWFVRYMDDGCILCHSLQQVTMCKKLIESRCSLLHITLNQKKLTVSKISRGFSFLKKRIKLDQQGRVIVRIGRSSITRARRRLKKLHARAQNPNDNFTFEDLEQSYKSWIGTAARFDNYYVVKNYRLLYNNLTAA